jgi:hypothetical protein
MFDRLKNFISSVGKKKRQAIFDENFRRVSALMKEENYQLSIRVDEWEEKSAGILQAQREFSKEQEQLKINQKLYEKTQQEHSEDIKTLKRLSRMDDSQRRKELGETGAFLLELFIDGGLPQPLRRAKRKKRDL